MCQINSNNLWQYTLSLFLIMAAIVGLIFGWSIYYRTKILSTNSTLTVSGEGKIYVKPDLAVVEASVVAQNKDFRLVQSEADTKMANVINFLKESGIEDKDIKTIQYNLQPQYDYSWCRISEFPVYCPPKLVDYILTQTIQIKVRDFEKLGNIIGNLSAVGVNQISGINFTVEKADEYQNKVREEAIAKAQAKALNISKASGVKLGKIIAVNEGTAPASIIRTMAKEELMAADVSAPIEAGSNEISVNISLTYEILK